MNSIEMIEKLKPFEARAIIESLRKGSVPVDFVPFFTVGRKNWLKFVEDDLEKYIAEGGSKVRFINGDYGDGKTHFMSVIKHIAMEKRFAVSFVVLTRDIPIHKFEVVYQQLVQQICTNEGVGIRTLINSWAEKTKNDLSFDDKESFSEKLANMGDKLRELPGMNLNFANALIALLYNLYAPIKDGDSDESRIQNIETLYQWFDGAKVPKRELKPFQVFEVLNKTNSKNLLGAVITFLRYLGYQGLIILLDELETVISQSTTIRNAAYENVRLLIDNTEHAQHLHIFFSIIPDVLSVEKGFKSYDALWSRVRSTGEEKRLNYRSVLIDLHRTPLETKEMFNLGLTLRRIHEISYRWAAKEAINDELINDICKIQKNMGALSEVRLFIKMIIQNLDLGEQGKTSETEPNLVDQITTCQREMEQEKLEQLQPKWDSE